MYLGMGVRAGDVEFSGGDELPDALRVVDVPLAGDDAQMLGS
jgi:hypothetical protein